MLVDSHSKGWHFVPAEGGVKGVGRGSGTYVERGAPVGECRSPVAVSPGATIGHCSSMLKICGSVSIAVEMF